MKRTMRVLAVFVIGAAVVFAITPPGGLVFVLARNSIFAPPAPPLLQHASAASGWWGACPPRNASEAKERSIWDNEALSPELNRNLSAQFPPGSSTETFVQSLTEQRFKLTSDCETDNTIHRAFFEGPTRGAVFDTIAEIYWKTDGDKVVWTKGFVSFVGL